MDILTDIPILLLKYAVFGHFHQITNFLRLHFEKKSPE